MRTCLNACAAGLLSTTLFTPSIITELSTSTVPYNERLLKNAVVPGILLVEWYSFVSL